MAPSRIGFSMKVDGLTRRRDSLKRTWMEAVSINLKKCNLSKYLAHERSKKINVADPNTVGTQGFNYDDDLWELR